MAASRVAPGDPTLAARLGRALEGEVRFDPFTRGLYATDASHYQIEPLGVVFPRSVEDVEATFEIAREAGSPVLPRGGGTSQCGQTVGRAIVLDTSRWLTDIGEPLGPDGGLLEAGVEVPASGIEVEPGVVLDHLNAALRPLGVWFPVDPSTGSRATIGGMAGNNSAGARSIRYGMMVDNVSAIEVVLADGRRTWLGEGVDPLEALPAKADSLRSLYAREADEILRRTPATMRNVAGYRLERLAPGRENLAQLLVGSEGTLAFFSRLRLRLAPLPRTKVVGVCHFPSLLQALDAVQHLVGLDPSAVELVDRNVLRLAAERPAFRDSMAGFVRGAPGALLLVEFASTSAGADERTRLVGKLDDLEGRMAELGFPGAVVRATTAEEQSAVWSVRKAGLNIVMSMAGPRKPISFIEDCAVPLDRLASYAQSVEEIFARHGVEGTWYAHASVGCLHVRPALDLKDPDDVALVRSIAEEVHAIVRRYGGAHSGEHGDGILRSEFLEPMLGRRLANAFAEVKRTFDPHGMLNPGKIVDAPRMDDRHLFRYPPEYRARALPVALDWSEAGGLLTAVERCNNNGACRKYRPDVMCPSFRVTHDERHSTRGRANALRLALTDQLGEQGLDSPDMAEAMSLCISCKGCRRECPTGVDMARMKLEWQHRRNQVHGVPLRERVLAALPRIAPRLHAFAPLLDLAGSTPLPGLAGFAKGRRLPRWHRAPWRGEELPPVGAPDVVLFVDTFTRWFEPENARAASRVLRAGGWSAMAPGTIRGRPLCCGRTYLSAGMLDEARAEASRTVRALAPRVRDGATVVGLEPSCLYTLKDEVPDLVRGAGARADARTVGEGAALLEEFLDAAWEEGRRIPLGPWRGAGARVVAEHEADTRRTGILVHGHCHQKAFGGTPATLRVLSRIPGADVTLVEAGCCGMAGAFGYHAEHYATSMAIGELALLPAVRAAPVDAVLVADGTSCRAQIIDGSGRTAHHAAVVLDRSLAAGHDGIG